MYLLTAIPSLYLHLWCCLCFNSDSSTLTQPPGSLVLRNADHILPLLKLSSVALRHTTRAKPSGPLCCSSFHLWGGPEVTRSSWTSRPSLTTCPQRGPLCWSTVMVKACIIARKPCVLVQHHGVCGPVLWPQAKPPRAFLTPSP